MMKKTILSLALFSLIIGLTSCQKGEEITITKYFQAMKQGDKDTLATMAIQPKIFKFKSFKVEKIEPGPATPLELPNLEKKMGELEQQKKDQASLASDKQDIYEELKDEAGENNPKTKAAEEAAKVEKDKFLALNREIGALKKKIEFEKNLITATAGVEGDFESIKGDTQITKVTVSVVMENNEKQEYIFLLRKNNLTKEGETRPLNSRIIIMKIGTPEELAKGDEETQAPEPQKTEAPQPAAPEKK
ncbi:MAG: hypothetical protein ACM3SY_10635 [Candidatus Omnitrophota bacterium]